MTTTIEPLGIENLKKFIKSLFKAMNTAMDVFEDGKVGGIDEYWELGQTGFNIFQAVRVAPIALQEWKDADTQEKEIIMTFIREEFDIPNDVIEARVEMALVSLITAGEHLWKAGLEIKALIKGQ